MQPEGALALREPGPAATQVLSLPSSLLPSLPPSPPPSPPLSPRPSPVASLLYLPMSIAQCSLKALWLSENQAQPLLKFQSEFDEASGQSVLTCFLLPQQAYHTESMGEWGRCKREDRRGMRGSMGKRYHLLEP